MSLTDTKIRQKQIYNITLLGSIINALLIVLKFIAGVIGHSGAMMADAVHSLSDFISDIIVLVFIKISSKPKDHNHAYGHGKYEHLATAVISLILVVVGGMLLYRSLFTIYRFFYFGTPIVKPGLIALWMAVVSIIAKEVLFRMTIRVGNKTKSTAVIANAWHHRSDAYSSIATLIGISGAFFLTDKWMILEPIAAAVVSIFIVKVGFTLFKPAFDGLSEASLPERTRKEILKVIESTPSIRSCRALYTRDLGNRWAIEAILLVDPTLTVLEAHSICDHVEDRLRSNFGEHTHLSIHIEPDPSMSDITNINKSAQ